MSQNRNFRPNGRFGAEAGLITALMYDALGWLVELLIRIKTDVITAKKLDILLVNVLRKLKMKGTSRYNSMGQGIYQFEDWEVQSGMMTMLGVLSI